MTGASDGETVDAFKELMAELARPRKNIRRAQARRKRAESVEKGALPCGDLTCPCWVRPDEKISGSRCRGR